MLRGQPFEMLVHVLDHDDGGVDHRADGDGNAAQAHDVGADAKSMDADEGHQYADWQHDDRHQRATHMQQEDDAHQRNDQRFLQQRAFKVGDGATNQFGTVIHRLDPDAIRQVAGDFSDAGLQAFDHCQRALPIARHGNPGNSFAFAVEFADATSLFRAKLDVGDVAQKHRRALVALHYELFDVRAVAQIAAAAHHEFGFRQFDDTSADVAVAGTDRLRHPAQRHAIGLQATRIDHDLVLPNEAAEAGDFGDAGRLGQLVAQLPVLDAAQLGQRFLCAKQHILVDPADAGGIRAKGRRHPLRQAAGRGAERFLHARTRPVDIRTVLEDHIHKGSAKEGKAAHDFRLRHRQHGAGERIGDLVLDDLWRLSGIFRVDDHLRVGKIGQGIKRRPEQRPNADAADEQHGQQHQEDVACRPGDEAG